MTERTEAERQAAFDAFMDASQALYEEMNAPDIAAGERGDHTYLRDEIRRLIDDQDISRRMLPAMIRETLNAFENGLRNRA